MAFEPDAKLEQVAEAYALDAVDFARQKFRINLDWSDSSVEQVELMLKQLHEQIPTVRPSKEQVLQCAKMFGSYVGEVLRRNHGARWGVVSLGNDRFPGMQSELAKGECWPWGKVQKRLLNGAEDNVWHYFQIVTEDSEQRT